MMCISIIDKKKLMKIIIDNYSDKRIKQSWDKAEANGIIVNSCCIRKPWKFD